MQASASDRWLESRPVGPALPLVSVVIVNFNYGRYVGAAIDSVFAQSYPHVECIVIDNGSTDNSATEIAACQARYPALAVLGLPENVGQTQGCIEGLARTRGPYVIFLDADDYLLRDGVATHMAVHLSARVHVGFTSADMLQVVDDQMVLSTNEASGQMLRDGKGLGNHLRPLAEVLGPLHERAEHLSNRVSLVSRDQHQWVWAPTSGNCFRRDALNLVCDGAGLPGLMAQTDLYLALAVNAINGSFLVDAPVFAYRLHGGNVFSNRAQLNGLLSFDAKRSGRQAALARRLIVDQFVTRIERFVQEPWMHWYLFKALRRLDSRVEEAGAWHGGSYAARAVARNFDRVAEAVGWMPALIFLLRGAPWRLKLRIALARRPVLG